MSVLDVATQQRFVTFNGAKLGKKSTQFDVFLTRIIISKGLIDWTHVKEIPNTKLLVSLHHAWVNAAIMEIFDLSGENRTRKIYSFEKTCGGNH